MAKNKPKPTITVKPVDGMRVMRHTMRGHITGETTVPLHPHYTRAIARGELVKVTPKAAKAAKKKEG